MTTFKIIGTTALLATAYSARELNRNADAIINKREEGDETFAKLDKNNPSLNKATALKQEMYKNWNKLNKEMKNQTGTSFSKLIAGNDKIYISCQEELEQQTKDMLETRKMQFKIEAGAPLSDVGKKLINEGRQINQELNKLNKDFKRQALGKVQEFFLKELQECDKMPELTPHEKAQSFKNFLSYRDSAEEYVNFTKKAFARQEKEKQETAKDLRITNLEQDLKNAEPVHHADFWELGAAMSKTGELWS
jgi:hypothetical protein